MLVKHLACTVRMLLVRLALRFGSTEPGPIDLGLFFGSILRGAFPMFVQVDQVTHARALQSIALPIKDWSAIGLPCICDARGTVPA